MTDSGSKPIKIGILGGGFSGICAGIQIERQLNIKSYTIFDANEDFGGTWLVNTYPGCGCDVQSHLYSYSFELNPNWSKNYAGRAEICEYLSDVARKYGLYSKVKFNSLVKLAEWEEQTGQWKVVIFDKSAGKEYTNYFDIIISGVGGLRVPNTPTEFENFDGPLMHSATWDNTVDLKDKVVGIIGSGASSVQIIPSIAPIVKELHVYQRNPAWVLPRVQFEFSTFLKKLFAILPIFMWILRAYIFLKNEFNFGAFKHNSFLGFLAMKLSKWMLNKQIPNNEQLKKKLTPNYRIGCKRIVIAESYYPTFNLPHVKLHTDRIQAVESNAIKTVDGTLQKIDVLIVATGFKVQDYFTPLKIIARNKINLLDKWQAEAPTSYYGIVAHEVPNAFFILGPNTGLGHNTIIFMIECQVNFMIQVITEWRKRNAKLVAVSKKAQDEWMHMVQIKMKDTVWGTESCGSWYADSKGRVSTIWPKSCISYYRETRKVDFSKFEFS